MSERKIPKHLSTSFHELRSTSDRSKFLDEYDNWLDSQYSAELVRYLESLLEREIESEERNNLFVSLFQSRYHSAHSRGRRSALRELIKIFRKTK